MVGATVCSSAVLAVGTPVGERLLSSIDVVDIEGVAVRAAVSKTASSVGAPVGERVLCFIVVVVEVEVVVVGAVVSATIFDVGAPVDKEGIAVVEFIGAFVVGGLF